ncbi:MAG: hypothetical protein HY726_06455 [Candidatus Rokubacteria bacterium]|nr:hypothetical protein [Candidatus Rokubacteria bacterium]
MANDRISRLLLGLIALFLGIISLKPFVAPPASAAAKPVRYRIIETTGGPLRQEFRDFEQLLNRVGAEGWEVVELVRGAVLLKQSD